MPPRLSSTGLAWPEPFLRTGLWRWSPESECTSRLSAVRHGLMVAVWRSPTPHFWRM